MLQFISPPPADNLLYLGSYNPLWVGVSIVLAFLSAYVALTIASRSQVSSTSLSSTLWILVASLTMGMGVWAMHFVGMLAFSLPCGVRYSFILTLISLIPGVLASAVALGVGWGNKIWRISPLISSVLFGAGIGTMHYTGMSALSIEGSVRYDPSLFALSIAIAIAFAYVALWFKNTVSCSKNSCNAMVAIIMGAAILGMHYVAMLSTYFVRGNAEDLPDSNFTVNSLAWMVSLTTLVLTLIVLVIAIFIRHREVSKKLMETEERWKFALEGVGDGVWDWNVQTDEVIFSSYWTKGLGYTAEEFPNTVNALMLLIHPADRDRVQEAIQQYLTRHEEIFECEYRMRAKNDIWRWFLVRGKVIERGVNGTPLRMIGTNADISMLKQSEQDLHLHASVYDNAWEGIIVTDLKGNIVSINRAFSELTGYSLEEVKGKNPKIFQSGKHDRQFYEKMWSQITESGHWRGEVWNKKKNGELYAEILSISAVKNEQGEIVNYVAASADITTLKETQSDLEVLANYDPLTDLPNRRVFGDRLAQEIRKSPRTGKPLAVLMIDLDKFKDVNDTLGHDKGDLLLIEAARRLKHCVREGDTVARLGGDEFAIILPDLEAIENVERIGKEILKKLAMPFNLDSEQAYVSASIGITVYPQDGLLAEDLVRNADQAMYLSKQKGRNCFSFFMPALQVTAQEKLKTINDLRVALSGEQLRVYFQPIIEMATGRIHKAEALVRWVHPKRGMISPAEFIPLAEETGLIFEIGDWVFEESMRCAKQWRDQYSPDFQVSVNKSPIQFYKDGDEHIEWLKFMSEHGMSGKSLVVELTEGMLIDSTSPVSGALTTFEREHIQVALDDFGTGYSSLSYLNKFDIDYLKIDQSFVHELETNLKNRALVEAIVVMAHKMNIKVIAEGVETEMQRELLQEAGCDYAQGFLFSKPVPAEQFELLLEKSLSI